MASVKLKISVQNQTENSSTEAWINFGKLPETPAEAISLQNLHISGHIETMNITAPCNNMRNLKFISPPTVEFFAAVNHKLNVQYVGNQRTVINRNLQK